MDFWTNIGISILLQLLTSRKDSEKNADAIAKVFVRARRLIESSPTLQKAVERQEAK
jgi:hypothetical protein